MAVQLRLNVLLRSFINPPNKLLTNECVGLDWVFMWCLGCEISTLNFAAVCKCSTQCANIYTVADYICPCS